MKRIIVPIDFSEHSEYALETAASIAKKYNSEVYVLHMLQLSNAIITASANSLNEEAVFYLKLAEQKMETFLDRPYLKGVNVIPVVKHFMVFKEINELVKAHDADLIVMGSHGASGAKEVLLGSNAEKVVRYADIPVLIVKHNPILVEFNTVVFASDFTDESVESYIKAKMIFEKLEANVRLVYVNTPNTDFKSSIEIDRLISRFLKKIEGNLDKFKEVTVVSDYSIEEGILNFANKVDADLIAITTHGRKGLAHFFEGSISEDVANHSTLPVMTFKL
ncbi:universal stress protein [Winogradskyella pulchriflava]|uniref:Universal stress protein n=1 Tax=Winogradskyella pulchriflava TaxID=1110688 RepID=A0ABV6QBM5_9FLAO